MYNLRQRNLCLCLMFRGEIENQFEGSEKGNPHDSKQHRKGIVLFLSINLLLINRCARKEHSLLCDLCKAFDKYHDPF